MKKVEKDNWIICKVFGINNKKIMCLILFLTVALGISGGIFLSFVDSAHPKFPSDAGCNSGFLNDFFAKIDKQIYDWGLDNSYGWCEDDVNFKYTDSFCVKGERGIMCMGGS